MIRKTSQEMPPSFHFDYVLVASLLDALMKCNDISAAESLFNRMTKKTLSMYGAMMKGKNIELLSKTPLMITGRFHQKSTTNQSH